MALHFWSTFQQRTGLLFCAVSFFPLFFVASIYRLGGPVHFLLCLFPVNIAAALSIALMTHPKSAGGAGADVEVEGRARQHF